MTTSSPQPGPTVIEVLKGLPPRIKRHNVVVAAAGIAFYGLLALVPTLLATVSIYGLVNQGNEEEITAQVKDAAGSLDDSTAEFISGILSGITSSGGNDLALVIGIALALFSASGAMQKLMGTVGIVYEAEENRPGWKIRLMAYGLTVGAILVVVVMVAMLGVVPALLAQVNLGGVASAAIQIGQLPLFGLLFIGGLSVLYRYAPDRSTPTPWLNPGSGVATVLWILFALMFSLYSTFVGGMPAAYGFIGSLAALMIFLQLTSIAVFIGAEYNAEREQQLNLPSVANKAQGAEATTEAEPLALGKAVAGLAALFVLGRGRN